ncbi:hypothetical protein JYU34_007577 [Plutella xylostella]|uniref:Hemocytin n=1 Tax=Plutella xylostella TaxID=51655 RepID=A0ABQ7QQR7_PLUXY|nr:hypothetical protein JYU34_007577 [Plutella xylostella]
MTFEGDDMPFEHNCTYLVSRDRNDTGVHKYQLQVMIDEEVVFKYPQKKDWVTVSLVNGQDVKILLPDEHVELTVSPSDLSFSVKVPSSLYSNATQGLCGVCAGYQEHLVMSNGTATDDYGQYAKSWQAKGEILTALKISDQEQCDEPPPKEECVPPPLELNPCNKLYDTQMFGACHALVDPASHVENCEADLCTNNTDICTVLERYVAECRRQGVCLQWRGQLCPWTCESPFIYRPCVGCDLTCDNYDEMKDGCDKPYLEGCYCPEGKVRVNNTCIEPTKCFPCDTNKEHYAGDEWQEDACTKCACSKLESSPMAHITCNKQTCSEPACADNEDLIAKPAPGACCREYVCVPKPIAIKCDEPKQIECGFGQVLKLKTKSDGCTEFACECKPADECDPIPPESKLEPGMTRDIDSTGCCPKEVITCRKETCPPPPECPKFHDVKSANVTGVCCLQYTCELPKDKCVVTLEWEAAPKGGEKLRAEPETLLKDLDEAWLDGPCRSCRCSPPLPAASCLVSSCPPAVSDDKFLVEPRPAPFACCPAIVQVACRDGNKIYKVGEKWSSSGNVCEHHECVQLEDGKLDKLTTVQMCDTKCQPGWQYTPPPPDSGECCGQCSAVACVVDGAEHQIGSTWTSPDHCTNYTCMDVNGTLQVQSSNESCPAITDDMKKLYVFEETAVPGKCCKNIERVACRDGDKIYQEGQTWNTSDPCVTVQCVRANSSVLSRESLTQHCAECGSGFERVPGGCCGHCRPTSCLTEDGMKDIGVCAYITPERPRRLDYSGELSRESLTQHCAECGSDFERVPGGCCGHCRPTSCLTEDGMKDIGATWSSADNCTTFSCLRSDGLSVLVSSSRVSCPRVDDCPPVDLVNETCCQVCKMRPQNLKPETCKPEPLPDAESVGIVRRRLGRHGLCRNMEPLPSFRECRGSCASGTLYNNQTGSHDTRCECCQAVKYESLLVTLRCEDGSAQAHRVASPARCDCRACGEISSMQGLDTHGYSGIKSPTKTGYSKKNPNDEIEEIEIPEIYKRFGEADDMNRVRR